MSGITALICARAGSKGLPNKNIRAFNGKPLIAHSINMANAISCIDNVFVSTDSPQIASIAEEYGAKVPFLRPSHLASDNASEWLVWQHALRYFGEINLPSNVLVVLPPTAPLRISDDVIRSIELFHETKCDGVVCGFPSNRNPFFNMVTIDNEFRCKLLSTRGNIRYTRRQDAPLVYELSTVSYVMRPNYVLNSTHLFDGDIRLCNVPAERALDIDTELDFCIAEHLSKSQLSVRV